MIMFFFNNSNITEGSEMEQMQSQPVFHGIFY